MRKHGLHLEACCKRRRTTPRTGGNKAFDVVDLGIKKELQNLSSQIATCYLPCKTSYLDAKGHWEISCYAELAKDVPDLMVPGATEHPPLLRVLTPLLENLMHHLSGWWHSMHPEKTGCQLRRVQSFVTKYSARQGQSHLTRHVDGPQVNASMILQLHSPQGFQGGGITVWDQQGPHFYQLRTGELCLLDHMVWHQSHEVTSGERWVLVVFCQEVAEPTSLTTVPNSATMTCEDAISLATLAADQCFKVEKPTVLGLMNMLRFGGDEEKERAAFAMGCLATNCQENQGLMMECGAAQLLADLLRESILVRSTKNATHERAWIVAALGRLASKNVSNKSIIAREGVIVEVVELIHIGNDLEREEAISTLCNLAANHESNKDNIMATGAVGILVNVLKQEACECIKERLWCMAALCNLAAGSVLVLESRELDCDTAFHFWYR